MPIELDNGATFPTFEACVAGLSDDPDVTEEEAERICGDAEQDKDVSTHEVLTIYADADGNISVAEAYERAMESHE